MSRVIAVVEGQTEQAFVREVLAPWLWEHGGLELRASVAGKPGKKGGNSYEKIRNDILNHLANSHFDYVTTFFDYYGMSDKWPGRASSRTQPHLQKAGTVETAMALDITPDVTSERAGRYIPYIQMHEFEALLFSRPSALADVIQVKKALKPLQKVRDLFSNPEEINDSPATAPSKRIEAVFRHYKKPLHGILAARQITIEVMREECPHFNDWIERLQHLGRTPEAS